MKETQVWSLGGEDPLEKEMTTHSSILAWKIPWTEETGGLQSMGSKELDTTDWLTLSLSFFHNSKKIHGTQVYFPELWTWDQS